MPLFHSNFFLKKIPNRKVKNRPVKNEELVGPQRTVQLSLGEADLWFSGGEWQILSRKNSDHPKNSKIKAKMETQKEENNLLNLKYELVLNMLTQATAENHIQQKDLENLDKSKKMVD